MSGEHKAANGFFEGFSNSEAAPTRDAARTKMSGEASAASQSAKSTAPQPTSDNPTVAANMSGSVRNHQPESAANNQSPQKTSTELPTIAAARKTSSLPRENPVNCPPLTTDVKRVPSAPNSPSDAVGLSKDPPTVAGQRTDPIPTQTVKMEQPGSAPIHNVALQPSSIAALSHVEEKDTNSTSGTSNREELKTQTALSAQQSEIGNLRTANTPTDITTTTSKGNLMPAHSSEERGRSAGGLHPLEIVGSREQMAQSNLPGPVMRTITGEKATVAALDSSRDVASTLEPPNNNRVHTDQTGFIQNIEQQPLRHLVDDKSIDGHAEHWTGISKPERAVATEQAGISTNGGSEIRIGGRGDAGISGGRQTGDGGHEIDDGRTVRSTRLISDGRVDDGRTISEARGDRRILDGERIGAGGSGTSGSRIIGGERIGDTGRGIGESRIFGGERIVDGNDKVPVNGHAIQDGRLIGDERIGAGNQVDGKVLGEKNSTPDKAPFTVRIGDQDVPIHGLIQDRIRTFNSNVERIMDNLEQRLRAPEVRELLDKRPNAVFDNLKNKEVKDCVVKFIGLVENRMLPAKLTDGMKNIVRTVEEIGKDTLRDLVQRVRRTPDGQAPKFHDVPSKPKFAFAQMVRLIIKELTEPAQRAITNLVHAARTILNTHFADRLVQENRPHGPRTNKAEQPCGKTIKIDRGRVPQTTIKSLKPKPVEVQPFRPAKADTPTRPVEAETPTRPVRIEQPVKTQPSQTTSDAPTRPGADGERAPFREMQEQIKVIEPRVHNLCAVCGSVNSDGAIKCVLCKRQLKSNSPQRSMVSNRIQPRKPRMTKVTPCA